MKYTEHLVFAVLLMPTATVLFAAALSLAAPEPATRTEVVAQYGALENQP